MSSALSASATGAAFLILIQVGSRALTFIINQALLRYLSPELLGASTQLELYSISVLYFARESIRVALQRQTGNAQAVINVSYVSITLGIPLAYLLGALYANSSLPDVPCIATAIKLYGVAACVELSTEPFFVFVQQKLAYKIRAAAETLATITRCVVTISIVIWAHRTSQDLGVLPFGVGQLAFAVCLFLVYYIRTAAVAKTDALALTPRKPTTTERDTYILSYFPRPICILAANIYVQSAIKYVLTQGDTLLVAALTTLPEQGAYALASNYGGLIARMLFQPIEESGRNLFSKLCALRPETQKPAPDGLVQASTTLELILRFYNLIALTAWSIGPSLAPTFLRIVAGSKWADTGAGDVLATYCYYIPLLALNGITEGFVAAVASNDDLRRQSVLMTLNFVAYASVAYLLLGFLGMGAQGLVWANCLNMLLRIIWNVSFIETFFSRYGKAFTISSTLPSTGSITAAVAAAAAAATLRARRVAPPSSVTAELMENLGLAISFSIALLVLERRFFISCYKIVKPQR